MLLRIMEFLLLMVAQDPQAVVSLRLIGGLVLQELIPLWTTGVGFFTRYNDFINGMGRCVTFTQQDEQQQQKQKSKTE